VEKLLNYPPQCTVTKIRNFIKGVNKFLNHRKFQQFLFDHNATYTDVPLHSKVRSKVHSKLHSKVGLVQGNVTKTFCNT